LQLKTSGDLDSFNRLIRVEEKLIAIVGKTAEMDGHDFGFGEMNIFFLPEDPIAPFKVVQQRDESVRPRDGRKAAYRPFDRDDYVCLEPPE
jgi:hypothetical protein